MNVRYFAVNCVLFWFRGYARGTWLDLSKTWVDNVRFSTSILCTKNWLIITNYRTAHWDIRSQYDDEQGINKLRPKYIHKNTYIYIYETVFPWIPYIYLHIYTLCTHHIYIYIYIYNIYYIYKNQYFFLKNTNLKQIVRSNIIQHDKKVIRSSNKLNGKCSPCLFNTRTFYCKQIVSTPSFKSYQTKCRFKIFDNINCKKDLHIYLDAIYIKSIMLGNVRLS